MKKPLDDKYIEGSFLSCVGLGCSLTEMILGMLHSRSELPDWFQFKDRDVIFTHQGRCAIALICQLLHIKSGDEVLVPAYNCGTEIDPFVWAGAQVVFYRIDNRAIIDIKDIFRRVTTSTRLIYVTHYFGWQQEIRELAQWCRERNIFLVEDCALSLFSGGPNNIIGHFGNAAIYSFPKSLPVPDGGALVLAKNSWHEHMKFRPSQHPNILRYALPLVKQNFLHKNKFWQHFKFLNKVLIKSWLVEPTRKDLEFRPMMASHYFDEKKLKFSISRLSERIISKTNNYKIVETRRRNYQHLYEAIINIGAIRPLFDNLPKNVCPLSFPVLVKDRTHWYNELYSHGILTYEWWAGYHQGFDWSEFPEARNLKNNLLTLPVHQNLNINHMDYIATCVRYIAKKVIKN